MVTRRNYTTSQTCSGPIDTHIQSQLGYSTRHMGTPPHTQNMIGRRCWYGPTSKDLVKGFVKCADPWNRKTAFRASSTLRGLLTHIKTPTPREEQKCVVYGVLCECGSMYVGERGRQVKTYIEEHKKAVLKSDCNNAIVAHV